MTASATLTPTGYNTSRSTFTGLSTVMWFQIMHGYVTLYCLYIAIKRVLSYADFDLYIRLWVPGELEALSRVSERNAKAPAHTDIMGMNCHSVLGLL